MKVVLDSTEIVSHGNLRSPTYERLFQAVTDGVLTVYVPQVVLDEVLHHRRREIQQELEKIAKNLDTLYQWGATRYTRLTAAEALQIAQSYQRDVMARMNEAGVPVLPYPAVAHQRLNEMASLRRKPFNNKGGGYKDALIWFSVLELAQASTDSIVLVSSNSDDFASEAKDALHSDLASVMQELGVPEGRVTWCNGLAALIESLPVVEPAGEEAADGLQVVESLDWNTVLRERLPEQVIGKPWEPKEIGLGSSFRSVTLDQVTAIGSFEIHSISGTELGRYFVSGHTEMDCVFKFTTLAEQWSRCFSEHGDIILKSESPPFQYVTGTLRHHVRGLLHANVGGAPLEVREIELAGIVNPNTGSIAISRTSDQEAAEILAMNQPPPMASRF